MSNRVATKLLAPKRTLLFGNRNDLGSISCCVTSSACSFSSSSPSITVTGPSKPLKSWESGARMVKDTTVENQYLEHIREVHDPSLHLKTIEDELKGTIGKALGKQGDKILAAMRLMQQEREKYDALLATSKNSQVVKEIRECIQKHNEYRAKCIQARWELTVHRQAVGFIVNNHNFVQEKFPIGESLPEWNSDNDNINNCSSSNREADRRVNGSNQKQQQKQQFGDQLDWWQRIGRWK